MQRPLATVVICGIVSLTGLTLLLPVLYRWAHWRDGTVSAMQASPADGR